MFASRYSSCPVGAGLFVRVLTDSEPAVAGLRDTYGVYGIRGEAVELMLVSYRLLANESGHRRRTSDLDVYVTSWFENISTRPTRLVVLCRSNERRINRLQASSKGN